MAFLGLEFGRQTHLVITYVPLLEQGLISSDILDTFVADSKYDILYSLRNQLFPRFQQCHGPSCVWWSCRLYFPRVDDMNDEGTMIQQDRVLPRKVSAAPGYLLIAPPASS